ncbi:hypothetical protein HNP48_004690 [Acidovorax soli]|uniref:Uncharacterized protein n=1 Tax=Acidovorax soli TaxID=592050 RepID=A0A7X0UBD3_9BURK|nr:hypothetical protein [Acidovorax soli]MBB6561988.1 hypothetical protein [Acidovorax soli]
MKIHLQGVAVALSLAVGSSVMAQSDLPTDADLKSSYCMGVLESKIAGMDEVYKTNPSLKQHEDFILQGPRNDLHRLRSYMAPRAKKLDIDALVAAKNRGVIDFRTARQHGQACLAQCPMEQVTNEKGSYDKWNKCFSACTALEPAYAREDSCKNINWLPF